MNVYGHVLDATRVVAAEAMDSVFGRPAVDVKSEETAQQTAGDEAKP